jgi:hypothetical protein
LTEDNKKLTGSKLREIRINKGITLTILSKELGRPRQVLSSMELQRVKIPDEFYVLWLQKLESIQLNLIDDKINRPIGYWDDPMNVLKEIKMRYDATKSLATKLVSSENGGLHLAARRHFGKWGNAILEFEKYYKVNVPDLKFKRRGYFQDNKENIIYEIKLRANKNLKLNTLKLREDVQGLYLAACREFGSWEKALAEAGFDYKQIKEDVPKSRNHGKTFEFILGEILTELNILYQKGFNRKLRPDFRIKYNQWIDAKLSEWSIYCCKTMEKYEPHCTLLTIVYLRGNKNKDKMISHKTRLISVYKLIKALPNYRYKYYIKILDDLLVEVEQDEIEEENKYKKFNRKK